MVDTKPYRHLLYTDFDGAALTSPQPLIGLGLDDDRHLSRVPELTAVVDDPTADPLDRLYACLALVGWGKQAVTSPSWPRRAQRVLRRGEACRATASMPLTTLSGCWQRRWG